MTVMYEEDTGPGCQQNTDFPSPSSSIVQEE